MIWQFQDLIGVPYVLGGRLPGPGTDCFGLVVECCRRLGRPIPDPFTSDPYVTDARQWIHERLGGWQPTLKPVMGGIVELRSEQQPAHVGFLMSDAEFLHSLKRTGVVVNRLDRDPWMYRVVGYYAYCP